MFFLCLICFLGLTVYLLFGYDWDFKNSSFDTIKPIVLVLIDCALLFCTGLFGQKLTDSRWLD